MTKSIDRDPPSQVRVIRRFNRFYARVLETLESNLFKDYSIAEMRILYELAHRPNITATQLVKSLGLDAGYLSRLLARMVRRRLLTRTKLARDARNRQLTLSKHGQQVFRKLDIAAQSRILTWLNTFDGLGRRKLIGALDVAMESTARKEAAPLVFRPLQPGDIGWITWRHAVEIAPDFGWNIEFEAMVAGILADFVANFDATSERSWVAERGGEILGSVFLVREDAETAKLRLLYVEKSARGLGLGKKLVEKTIRFAQGAGYKRLSLYTTQENTAARRIYETFGFKLLRKESPEAFSNGTAGEVWELDLKTAVIPA